MCWLKNVADHSRTSLAGAGCAAQSLRKRWTSRS
jgi:hypothetical protein